MRRRGDLDRIPLPDYVQYKQGICPKAEATAQQLIMFGSCRGATTSQRAQLRGAAQGDGGAHVAARSIAPYRRQHHPQAELRGTVKMLQEWSAAMPRAMGYDENGPETTSPPGRPRPARSSRGARFMPAKVTKPKAWLLCWSQPRASPASSGHRVALRRPHPRLPARAGWHGEARRDHAGLPRAWLLRARSGRRDHEGAVSTKRKRTRAATTTMARNSPGAAISSTPLPARLRAAVRSR